MNQGQITLKLNREDFRSFIRYDLTYSEIMNKKIQEKYPLDYEDINIFQDLIFEIQEDYHIQLEDLIHVFEKIKQEGFSLDEFEEEYLTPLDCEAFMEGLHIEEIMDHEWGLPESDENMMAYLLDRFQNICSAKKGCYVGCVDYDYISNKIQYYLEDKDKPLLERRFVRGDLSDFIFDRDDYNELSKEHQELYRKTIDEFCQEGDIDAKKIKAYLCYGGSDAYPCDWQLSKDYLLDVFAACPDARVANTLGYIYYYGRCNDGVPEYDKAFYYFNIGAAGGIYESIYKLGDMYYNGYGVPKLPQLGIDQYHSIYQENKTEFEKGYNNNLADVALRLAKVSFDMPESYGLDEAYTYILEAKLALEKRKGKNHYGDSVVSQNIDKVLESVKNSYHEENPYTNEVHYGNDFLFLNTLNYTKTNCMEAKISRIRDQFFDFKITFLQDADLIMTPGIPPKERIFCMPEADYCDLVNEVHFIINNLRTFEYNSSANTFTFNYVEYNYTEDVFYFIHDNVLSAKIKVDDFFWQKPD